MMNGTMLRIVEDDDFEGSELDLFEGGKQEKVALRYQAKVPQELFSSQPRPQ